ncbi:SsrA-binding protein [Candidatus Peregrinibacteria bacterium RIFCSPLOWO2_01_FULL_39_12]|nr:MAG: SsrA-binding protein [Candidatus Peregrinibacteria bacterium RIFCSPLOWO2_01_FULL_39_12]OGJ42669.1 MAG: SsrA-binding protein [Candidatus Peregrinibacteria bacterium RIFCSPLOWO2_02_FULL_39_10]
MSKPKPKQALTSYSKNKKAYHAYEILEKYEAGIVLTGEEVKSIRTGQSNLKGSFVDISGDEAFLNEAHISRYKFSSNKDYNPTRKRKLLLHIKEILKISQAIAQKGVTAIPLEFYGKGHLIKMEIGICRGKKLYDKRETLKKRDQEMEIKIQLKRWQR